MRSFVRSFVCLLVCLSVCLSICSPALAAGTTDSMIDFMPYAAPSFSAKFGPISYNVATDSITNLGTKSVSGPNLGPSPNYYKSADLSFSTVSPYYGFTVQLSDLSLGASDSLRVLLNRFSVFSAFWDADNAKFWPALDMSVASPFTCYATYTWSGTGYRPPANDSDPGSWMTISNQSGRTDVGFLATNNDLIGNDDFGADYNRPLSDIEMSLSFDIPATYTKNGYTYEVRSANIQSVNIYCVFNYTPNVLLDTAGYLSDLGILSFYGFNFYVRPTFYNAYGRDMINVLVSNGGSGSDVTGGLIAGVQQSIGKLNQTVTTEINEVKQEIVKGAETVKNEIQNQTQKVEQGFTSVTDKMDDNITKVEEGFTAVTDGIKEQTTEVKESVDSLPEKFRELFLELFIPPEEELTAFYDKFSALMSSKLGFIWQVIDDILLGLFRTLMNGFTDPQTTITIPAVSLPFPGANMSLWPEMTFPIIPPGLEFLATFTKRLSDVVMVLLVINRALDFRNTFFEYYTAAAPVGEQIANEYFAEQDRKAANRAYYQKRANFAKARGRR